MTKVTQCNRVLAYIKAYGSITQEEAMTALGVARLGARIWDLKHKLGLPIETEMITVRNRFGEACRVASYSIAAE